jgi:hypothetical protein
VLLPLQKREFDLQQQLPSTAAGGLLAHAVLDDVRAIVTASSDFKNTAGSSSSSSSSARACSDHLDYLDSILSRWAKRDAPFNRRLGLPNPNP